MIAATDCVLRVRRRLSVAALFSLVTALVGCGGSAAAPPAASPTQSGGGEGAAEVGKPAPDLSIQSINGKGKISLDGKAGKVMVIDFWATWCAPCKASFPQLEALSKKAGDKVEVVGISVDDDKSGVLEFAKANGATFAIGWDENQQIAKRWKVDKMPTTFIVDSVGRVRYIHAAYHDGETDVMEKELAVLAEEASSGGTKVAKTDKTETKEEKPEPKEEPKPEAKPEPKPEPTASNDDPKPDAAATPKKKGAAAPKKGGAAGGKAKPPKKAAPKKK
jgi:thiol-disulfide isomerase/thioredoxin